MFAGMVHAQDALHYESKLSEPSIFDPAFQDFVETVYGYKNPQNGLGAEGLRDAVADKPAAFKPAAAKPAPVAAPVKPSVSVKPAASSLFVAIFPRNGDAAGLISMLTSLNGFSLSGERVVHSALGKKTAVVGWAAAATIPSLCGNPAVLGVFTGTAGSYSSACPGK